MHTQRLGASRVVKQVRLGFLTLLAYSLRVFFLNYVFSSSNYCVSAKVLISQGLIVQGNVKMIAIHQAD